MAIIRRACGPRVVILPNDTAIDDGLDEETGDLLSDLTAYREGFFEDEGLLKLKPGEFPTRWRISPLTPQRRREMHVYRSVEREFTEFIVRCGLLGHEGYQIIGDDGPIEAPQPDRKKPSDVASQQWLDSMNLDTETLGMLAGAILHISEASGPLSRPSSRDAGS